MQNYLDLLDPKRLGFVMWSSWHCITLKKKGCLSEYLIPAQNSPRLPEIIGPILGEMLDPDSSNI